MERLVSRQTGSVQSKVDNIYTEGDQLCIDLLQPFGRQSFLRGTENQSKRAANPS